MITKDLVPRGVPDASGSGRPADAGGLRGRLISRTQPAHGARPLLRHALGVQRDDAGDDLGIGQVAGPAIGVGDGIIEPVVQGAQDADLPGVVDIALLGRERRARADRREGQRNLWLRTLDRVGLGFDS